MRRSMGFAAGIVCGVFLVATCSMTGGPGGLLGDMAGLFGDGAQQSDGAMLDIASADAQSGTMLSGACDKIQTMTTTVTATGATTTQNYYFAEFSVPGLDPSAAPHISATICGRVKTGNIAEAIDRVCGTAAGTTCNMTGYSPAAATYDCTDALVKYVSPSKVIVWCGYDLALSATPASNYALYRQTAYLRVN